MEFSEGHMLRLESHNDRVVQVARWDYESPGVITHTPEKVIMTTVSNKADHGLTSNSMPSRGYRKTVGEIIMNFRLAKSYFLLHRTENYLPLRN